MWGYAVHATCMGEIWSLRQAETWNGGGGGGGEPEF